MEENNITVGIPFYSKTLPDEFTLSIDSILKQSLKPSVIHFIQDGPINSKLQVVINDYLSSHNNIIHIKLKCLLYYEFNISILINIFLDVQP